MVDSLHFLLCTYHHPLAFLSNWIIELINNNFNSRGELPVDRQHSIKEWRINRHTEITVITLQPAVIANLAAFVTRKLHYALLVGHIFSFPTTLIYIRGESTSTKCRAPAAGTLNYSDYLMDRSPRADSMLVDGFDLVLTHLPRTNEMV